MYYKKSKDIEDRFTTALALIFFFKPNVENLAMRLNVSRPTRKEASDFSEASVLR